MYHCCCSLLKFNILFSETKILTKLSLHNQRELTSSELIYAGEITLSFLSFIKGGKLSHCLKICFCHQYYNH
jgi:hypothetical protein